MLVDNRGMKTLKLKVTAETAPILNGIAVVVETPQQIYRRAYLKAYQKSAKRKAYMKAYEKSAKRKAYMKAYRKSAKYKAYQKAYKKSAKYKAYRKAYRKAYAKSAKHKAYLKTPKYILLQAASGLLHRLPGTSVATRKEIVVCKRLIKKLKGDV